MKKTFPKKFKCLLADLVREEPGGKMTVIGLYTTDEIVLQGALPKQIPEGMVGVAIPSLTILAVLGDGHGKFSLNLQVYDPAGKAFGKGLPGSFELKKGEGQNVILPLVPFPIHAFGKYRMELQLDEQKYTYSFIVRHQDPNMRLPVVVPVVPPEAKKSRATRKPK